MSHYADGTEAKLGDLVTGVSHSGPREITGKVIQITRSCTTCNLAIAYINENSPVFFNLNITKCPEQEGHAQLGWGAMVLPIKITKCPEQEGHSQLGWGAMVLPSVAHGDADKFRKVET